VLRNADELAQPVGADLHVAVLVEDVAGLQVAVDDAAVVQVAEALGDLAEEERGFLRAEALVAFRDE